MSLTSSRLCPPTIPLSSSEESEDESLSCVLKAVSSPTLHLKKHHTLAAPVQDFKESLENERNMRKLFSKLDSMHVRSPMNGGGGEESMENEKNIKKIVSKLDSMNARSSQIGSDFMSGLEKNYKLQIQTLLEEVNQLKLDKKLLERKNEKVKKESKIFDKVRYDGPVEPSEEEPIMRKMLEAKNSTIRELEFQVNQLKIENNNMKTRMDIQKQQIDQFFERLADAESYKDIIEEKDEELDRLRRTLYNEEVKMEKVLQELSYLKNENIALKVKGVCTPTNQAPTAGATSFWNQPCSSASKDVSFFSLVEKFSGNGHQRNSSDTNKTPGKILNLSELNDIGSMSPKIHMQQHPVPLLRSKTFVLSSTNRRTDSPELPFTLQTEKGQKGRTKSELSQLQKLSVKMLSEYEKGIKTNGKAEKKKDSKTLDRIIEVNKIKNYYIEEQNKKLLSILSVAKGERTEGLTNIKVN